MEWVKWLYSKLDTQVWSHQLLWDKCSLTSRFANKIGSECYPTLCRKLAESSWIMLSPWFLSQCLCCEYMAKIICLSVCTSAATQYPGLQTSILYLERNDQNRLILYKKTSLHRLAFFYHFLPEKRWFEKRNLLASSNLVTAHLAPHGPLIVTVYVQHFPLMCASDISLHTSITGHW